MEPDTKIIERDPTAVYNSFDEMDLKIELLRGIYGYGFETPSSIQSRGIIPLVCGRDILGQAQSGTGKTGTFTIGVLQSIDSEVKALQSIVMAPTHELARQIYDVFYALSSHMNLKLHVATGGSPVRDDIAALAGGCQVLIGTPGRIYDLMGRKAISTIHVRILVIDEADQMLEQNFQQQIVEILQVGFPETTQVALFSATLPVDVVQFAEKMLNNPIRILVATDMVTLDGIKQYRCVVGREEYKFEALCDIYKHFTISHALIYCNQKKKAEWLAAKMKDSGFLLECIHGEMDAGERKRKMQDFRSGVIRVLISTDLLARGIDVQQVSTVINYDLPLQKENYIHRIGRSGRYGKKGIAINLITDHDVNYMNEIQTYYCTKIVELPADFEKITVG